MAFLLQKHNVAVIYGDAYPPEFIHDSRSNRKYAGTKFQLCILHSLQVRFSCNLQSKDLQCKAAPSGCITVVHFLFPPTGLLPLQYVNHNIQLEKEKRLYLESCRHHQMDRPDLPCKINKISKRLRLGWPVPADFGRWPPSIIFI